jgi:hypothetical protein
MTENINKKAISSKYKIILFCTIYNLIAEFSTRGFIGFFYNLMVLWLFLAYFTFFLIILHIAYISKGSDLAILFGSITWALPIAFFSTGTPFFTGEIIGYSLSIIIIMFFMWGMTQTWLPLYVSGKLFGWNIPDSNLSRKGWILCLLYLFGFCAFAFPGAIKGPIYLYVISIILMIFFIVVTRKFIKSAKENPVQFRTSVTNEKKKKQIRDYKILIYLFWLSVIAALLTGIIIPFYYPLTRLDRPFYIQAFLLMILWSIISGVVITIYRGKSGPFPMPGILFLDN